VSVVLLCLIPPASLARERRSSSRRPHRDLGGRFSMSLTSLSPTCVGATMSGASRPPPGQVPNAQAAPFSAATFTQPHHA
jgi:hypothetical protein